MEMAMQVWAAMGMFAVAMSLSPGPVNMLIVTAAVNHGFRAAMTVVTGATVGFVLLLAVVAFGLVGWLERYPMVLHILALAGALFIVYIAWKIAQSSADLATNSMPQPRLRDGFLLQWLNPKAWIACAAGAAMFAHAPVWQPLWAFLLIYAPICYVSLALWAVLGARLTGCLRQGSKLRLFNRVMGLLLLLSAGMMLYPQLRGIWL